LPAFTFVKQQINLPADQILLCEVRATMKRVILTRLDGTFEAKRSLLRMD
jgi:hypothetical protein